MLEVLIVFMVAIISSLIAPIMGIGGGSIFVPLLDLTTNRELKEIIPISSASIPATAMRSTARYLDRGIVNLRLAVVMVSLAMLGAFFGALVMLQTPERILRGVFGIVLLYGGYKILKKRRIILGEPKERNFFTASYYDEAEGRHIVYTPKNITKGLPLVFLGGFLSGLLGIGGGVVYTTVFILVLCMPPRIAVTLSMTLILFSTTISALVYISTGRLIVELAAVAILGSFIGSTIGSRLALRIKNDHIKKIFVAFLTLMGLKMVLSSVFPTLLE